MSFHISTHRQAGVMAGLDPTIYVLEDGSGGRAEVWPALGFNCFRWLAPGSLDLLYADPALFTGGRPTRSGIPVLFPFPNRIRAGRFTWAGKEYQLPTDDPAKKNAIHGFACRHPWRVANQGSDEHSAWVSGVFRCSVDAPASRPLWPADHEIRLTVRLGAGLLRLEAEALNPDEVPLPFGLGYHPYFRLPFSAGVEQASCAVSVPARDCWVLEENVPTGERRPVDPARDLNAPRRVSELQLDDVLTGLPDEPPGPDALIERGVVEGGAPLRLFCSPAFRELVVFTAPHRQAFCIEPYTCTTDAINLQQQGVDAGWLVLPPGGRWRAVVELRV